MSKFRQGQVAEAYITARNFVALMDRSYHGIIKISGKDHVDLLHRLTTNELRNLGPGEGQMNVFTNEKGRIVDRVVLYKLDDEIWLIPSPRNSDKIAAWIDKYIFLEDVRVEKITSGMLSLFGPQSPAFLHAMFNQDFEALPDNYFDNIQWHGHPLQIARTEELGFPGFNLILSSELIPELRQQILKRGSEFDLKPMDQGVYEILRVEAGWPLYDKDFNDQINPHEAQFLPYLSFTKGCYIGQEVVARLDTYEKVQKYLVGIILEGDAMPKEKDVILVHDQEAGWLTSVVHSMALRKNIALGYVRTKFISENVDVLIKSDDELISGTLVKLPFKT
jgi:folate-binding protein YgfZ